jgi:pyridoxal phosphate enzyme (YggS family)
MDVGHLAGRLEAVRGRIAAAARRAGRDPAEVRIVAVTKGHPLATAREAGAAGLLDLGENRVQEALAKMDGWPGAPVRWHLIGHLQRNKVRHALGRFALIQSLDSLRLADALEQAAAEREVTQPVLVEVNVAGEAQKSGCPLADAPALVAHAAALPHLRLRGLMTMAPYTDDGAVQRAAFGGLRVLRERLAEGADGRRLAADGCLEELSMGMTNDFEVAIEEGATLVRLGTALFGERIP